jgi:predicted esterase YcpF (UPF0227 family)
MKARMVGERVRHEHPTVTWWCPQLPPSPRAAAELIRQVTVGWPRERLAVVGSSLGGFYARWFALQTGCRAVLLNPASFPARDLSAHIGEQTTWQNPDERFFFEPAFVNELRLLEADIARLAPLNPMTPDRLMAIVAKGDEVLDWREMQAFCEGGDVRLLEGGDHAISDFEEHMDAVFGFLRLA